MAVDRNASDVIRLRRNQQRGRAGGLTPGIAVAAPLRNTGSQIQLGIDSAGGLESSSGNLRVKLIDTSLTRDATGLGVALRTNSGLQISSGLGLQLNGTTLLLGASGLSVNSGGIGAAQLGVLTTKGDLLGYSTTHVRVSVGTDGQVITADSTQAAGWKWAPSGAASSSKLFYSGTTSTAIAATGPSATTELAFDQGFLMPANTLTAGKAIRMVFSGKYIQAAGTINLRVYAGPSAPLDLGIFTPITSATERSWQCDITLLCLTAGASGTLRATAVLTFSAQVPLVANTTADFAFDTTVARALQMTAQWGTANAGNVINTKLVQMIME